MKKYNEFINESLFGKRKGDDFTKNLLDIIEKENIKINFDNSTNAKYSMFNGSYNVNVDGIDYYFTNYQTIGTIISENYIVINGDKIRISHELFKRMKNIYKNQNRDINFPDISDLGRATNKYNL